MVRQLVILNLAAIAVLAQTSGPERPSSGNKPEQVLAPPAPAAPQAPQELSLAGKTETDKGESRRNENVQVNMVDNNALKELQQRMGASATIVDEFKPDRNYFSSEYGNRVPAPIHVPAQTGAGFHGQLSWTHMNSILRARSFFQVGKVLPARENGFGASAGFRPWKGAYFFGDGSLNRVRGMVNGNVLIPRLDERSPLLVNPRTGLPTPAANPETRAVVLRFLNAFPAIAPNRTDINERALNTNAPQSIDTNTLTSRFEQRIRSRDRLSAQHSWTEQNIAAYQFVKGQNPNTISRAHTARLTWTRSWNPRTVTNLSAGFDRVGTILSPAEGSVGPTVNFANILQELGPSSSVPLNRVINRFRYAGELRQSRGKHQWSAGFSVSRRQTNSDEFSGHRGYFYFRNDFGNDGISNLRMGLPSRFAGSLGSTRFDFRAVEQEYFVGDVWRVHPRLTLNASLRYEPFITPRERLGRVPIDVASDRNNLSPRFGLAWNMPRKLGVMRASYGTHYMEPMAVTLQQVRFNPPGSIKVEVQAPNLANPYDKLKPEDVSPDGRSIFVYLDPNLRSPYSHQYSFSWEPALANRWRLNIGYVGSRTMKLLLSWYTNRALPDPNPALNTTATINNRRPDTRYYDFRRVVNASIGYYDAARVTVTAPSWRGLTFDASYWFSKAIDLGGTYINTATGEDARQGQSQSELPLQSDLKGLSSFDQPHALLAHVFYNTPSLTRAPGWLRKGVGRWNLMAVYLAKSGTPFTVVSGSDGPGFGNVDGAPADRVNVLDPSVLGRTIGNPDTALAMLPRSAFAFIRPGETRGNIGVNTFRKGGIFNMNFALARDFRIAGERTLVLRAEAVNLFNTPQFADPGRELASPNFGQITNTLNEGRTIQFAIRLRW